MAQRTSGYARKPDDEYLTPAPAVVSIVPYLRAHGLHYLWETCAADDDGMGETLRRASFEVWSTCDDFLRYQTTPDGRIEAAIFNPPYGRQGRVACAFIEHALRLVPRVIALLAIDFDSAIGRTHLFRDHPSFRQKLVLLGRIVWLTDGLNNPSMNHAWYCWDREHNGPPTISYVRLGEVSI